VYIVQELRDLVVLELAWTLCPFSVLVTVKQADLPDCIVLWILKNLAIA